MPSGPDGADLTHIHRTRYAVRDRRTRQLRILGDPQHASQVVTTAAGKHTEHGAGDRTQRIRDRTDHSITAERDRGLACSGGLARKRTSVLEIARIHPADLQAVALEGALDRPEPRAAPARRRRPD